MVHYYGNLRLSEHASCRNVYNYSALHNHQLKLFDCFGNQLTVLQLDIAVKVTTHLSDYQSVHILAMSHTYVNVVTLQLPTSSSANKTVVLLSLLSCNYWF